jgi:hypothetical protein
MSWKLFFQNEHLYTNTLSRFSKIILGGLFVTGKISAALINSLLEAEELMTNDERDDVVLQRSLINRAFNHLSLLEPARIKLTTEVSKCKTLKSVHYQQYLTVFPDIPNKFIDDDKIDQLTNDTFCPWTVEGS